MSHIRLAPSATPGGLVFETDGREYVILIGLGGISWWLSREPHDPKVWKDVDFCVVRPDNPEEE